MNAHLLLDGQPRVVQVLHIFQGTMVSSTRHVTLTSASVGLGAVDQGAPEVRSLVPPSSRFN